MGTEEIGKIVHPCICGHRLEAHGEVEEGGGWDWDIDPEGNEVERYRQPEPRPICWDCGPGDCIFQEMDNLEFLEMKSEQKDAK